MSTKPNERGGVYLKRIQNSDSEDDPKAWKQNGLTNKEIDGAIRFSFSPHNTIEEADYTVDMIIKNAISFFIKTPHIL